MNAVSKQAPIEEVSDIEVVADIFQVVRAREIKNVEGVKEVFQELFPGMTQDRQERCLGKLATILVRANPEVLSVRQRQRMGFS